MKNNRLFNSDQETQYRILLLLSVDDNQVISKDRILALDFISVYGKVFGISSSNLNGDNSYMYGELNARRQLLYASLKKLVLLQYVKFYANKNGFLYQIADAGKSLAKEFSSDYSVEYLKAVKSALMKYKNDSDQRLMNVIIEKAIREEESI